MTAVGHGGDSARTGVWIGSGERDDQGTGDRGGGRRRMLRTGLRGIPRPVDDGQCARGRREFAAPGKNRAGRDRTARVRCPGQEPRWAGPHPDCHSTVAAYNDCGRSPSWQRFGHLDGSNRSRLAAGPGGGAGQRWSYAVQWRCRRSGACPEGRLGQRVGRRTPCSSSSSPAAISRSAAACSARLRERRGRAPGAAGRGRGAAPRQR